jgi:hypothetical protein
LATGADAGRKTVIFSPAAAPIAAMLDAAFPVEARAISTMPRSRAKAATR